MSDKAKLAKDKIKSNYSGSDSYDLIIIGAGISGLSSGVMWLLNTEGKKTLILDKNGYTGGYVTAYERGGYIFETTQLFPDLTDVLDYLGLDLNLKQYKANFMRRIVVHGDEVDEYKIPTGAENFAEYLSGIFPEDAKKIKNLMDYSVSLFTQVRKLKALPKPKDMILTPFVAPKVVMSLNRTYSGLLDKFGITNIKLREVLDTFAAFSGVPSDRASAILATGAMLSSMTKCFRPYGFYDEFPAKMTQLFQKLGGELLLSTPVEKIVVKDGKAVGVRVKGEKGMIRAEKIITTIDPMVAMRKLVGDGNLPPKYVERLKKTQMSPSSINIALGLDDKIDLKKMDIDYPYNVVSTGTGTMGKLFDGFLAGDNAFTDDCFHAGAICPSLTTGAKNTITIRGVPFGINGWLKWREKDRKRYKEEKERWVISL
jgi:phytoene dehydrogenase-like protein